MMFEASILSVSGTSTSLNIDDQATSQYYHRYHWVWLRVNESIQRGIYGHLGPCIHLQSKSYRIRTTFASYTCHYATNEGDLLYLNHRELFTMCIYGSCWFLYFWFLSLYKLGCRIASMSLQIVQKAPRC